MFPKCFDVNKIDEMFLFTYFYPKVSQDFKDRT